MTTCTFLTCLTCLIVSGNNTIQPPPFWFPVCHPPQNFMSLLVWSIPNQPAIFEQQPTTSQWPLLSQDYNQYQAPWQRCCPRPQPNQPSPNPFVPNFVLGLQPLPSPLATMLSQATINTTQPRSQLCHFCVSTILTNPQHLTYLTILDPPPTLPSQSTSSKQTPL